MKSPLLPPIDRRFRGSIALAQAAAKPDSQTLSIAPYGVIAAAFN